MKTLLIFVTILFLTFVAVGQTKNNCNCPTKTITHTGKPDNIFKFSNGKTLSICGYTAIEQKQKTFSEFILYQCGQPKIIAEWGALKTCTVEQKDDTLIVQELHYISNGKDFKPLWTKFYITKYFWRSSKLKDTSFYQKNLRKYSAAEIKKVLTQYEQLKKPYDYEKSYFLPHRLFWAYVSGSKTAEKYLVNFENKFGPFDGESGEDFHDLIDTYKDYKIK